MLKIAEADEKIFEPDAHQCLALDCAGNRRILMNLAAMALQVAAERNEKDITADLVNTSPQNAGRKKQTGRR